MIPPPIEIFWPGRVKDQTCCSVLCNFFFFFSLDEKVLILSFFTSWLPSCWLPHFYYKALPLQSDPFSVLYHSLTLACEVCSKWTSLILNKLNAFNFNQIEVAIVCCLPIVWRGKPLFCLGEIRGDHLAWTVSTPRTETSLGKLDDMWNITFFTHLHFFLCHFNITPLPTLY